MWWRCIEYIRRNRCDVIVGYSPYGEIIRNLNCVFPRQLRRFQIRDGWRFELQDRQENQCQGGQ